MKRLFLLIPAVLLSLVIANPGLAQQVPDKAQAAFNKKFPNAQHVHWGKEGTREYEAEFTLNGNQMSANFDAQGSWKETETAIAMSQLPDAVQQTLSRDYKNVTVKHAFKVESPDPTVYEVEVQSGEKHEKMENEEEENDEHGEENEENEKYEHENNVHELVFTQDGKVVHQQKEEEDED